MTATLPQPVADQTPSQSDSLPAVSVQNVDKTFRLPHRQYNTLKERALHPFQSRSFDELNALRDISFDVAPGEFFGIVGRNGSGKSTLLKCLAGIYSVETGSIDVRGRLSPFIELGVGFNPEMTARDNVVINAIMLGLSRKEARARFDEIIEFAELKDFVDLKLKNYSSGMSVRLGFAVAIQADADVLLVDEVLAVGDAAFQQKCFDQFDRLKKDGRTVLFVSHDMSSMSRFCDRAILIERGRIIESGDPDAVGRAYGEINYGDAPTEVELEEGERPAAGIIDCWCEDQSGARVFSHDWGQPVQVCAEVEFNEVRVDPVVSVTFRNEVRHTIAVSTTAAVDPATGTYGAGDRAVFRFTFDNWLAPSRYTLTPSVAESYGAPPLAVREDAATLLVKSPLRSGGVIDIPQRYEVEER